MTPQERDLLTTLLGRLRSTAAPAQPKDPDADRLIRQAVTEQPDLPYYLVQTVLIQDLSLHQAQARIAELEQQVADANQSQPTSFLGRLLGGGQSAQPSGSSGGPDSGGADYGGGGDYSGGGGGDYSGGGGGDYGGGGGGDFGGGGDPSC